MLVYDAGTAGREGPALWLTLPDRLRGQRSTRFARSASLVIDGDVSLAFHLVDGKKVRLQYVSGLTVPVAALSAFALDGSVKGRVKHYDRSLKEEIDRIVPATQIRVPLVRVAFDIVMRTRLHFPFSADRTYSNQVPQLLKHCGIVQPVEMFDPNKHEAVLVPFCDAPLIRLSQRTHLELVNAQMGKKGATGRDFPGMDEIEALSKLPLSEYRILNALGLRAVVYRPVVGG